MSIRSSGYTQEEDRFLCQTYMDISQDPIKGAYQSSDQFWARVAEAYNNGKNPTWSERSKRSRQSRIQTIEKATKKLHACIRQCENRRPSGASNDDILNQAKIMLAEDPNFKKGWKFDHVWNTIKDFEKFQDGVTSTKHVSNPCGFGYTPLETENSNHDSGRQTSPCLSSFSPNIDDDEIIGGSPSQRPSGIKKSKMKRKIDDGTSAVINSLEEGNKLLLEQLKKSNAQRQHHLEIQSKNYALKEFKEENKFLFQDLNSIQDPNLRAYVQSEQTRIYQKRAEQQQCQQDPPQSASFGQYFSDFGGSGSDLPDY